MTFPITTENTLFFWNDLNQQCIRFMLRKSNVIARERKFE